jgi:Tfp pilus assembly protein PilF
MRSRAAALCLLTVLFPLAACSGSGQPSPAAAQLAFGVDMARHGLWDEALFRFQEAERLDPSNPRIQSNMGVAYEASGQFDKALEAYKKALSLAPNDKDIRANYGRFVEFYQGFKGEKTAAGDTKAAPAKPPSPPPSAAPAPATPPVGEEPPSTPEDVPPPPADNRPPR